MRLKLNIRKYTKRSDSGMLTESWKNPSNVRSSDWSLKILKTPKGIYLPASMLRNMSLQLKLVSNLPIE